MQKKAIAEQLLIAMKAIDKAQRLINEHNSEKYAVVVQLIHHYQHIKTILNDNFDNLS